MKIIFLFLLLSITACAPRTSNIGDLPQLSSINIIDRNGMSETINNPERLDQYAFVDFLSPQPYQKVLRIYLRNPQGNIPACITNYHSNGQIRQYLEVVNSRASGIYKEWHPNGQLQISAQVIEGVADLAEGSEKTWLFDGCCQVFDNQGNQEASIPYNKGKLDGVSIYYHSNGLIWKSIPYLQGKVHGGVEVFCSDGSLLKRVNFVNGVKEGASIRYWSGGMVAAEEVYSEGLLLSGHYYDIQGSCVASIEEGTGLRAVFSKDFICEIQEYHHGILDGIIQVLDQYGRITNFYHVKNGCKHGEELCFYEAVRLQKILTPKISINWYEGKVQGICKSWYLNGIQESQKEMSNNKKNGHHSAWYRDGSLLMIEEYEQDKLVRGEYYAKGEKWPVSIIENGQGIATLFDGDGNLKQKIEYRDGKPQLDEGFKMGK